MSFISCHLSGMSWLGVALSADNGSKPVRPPKAITDVEKAGVEQAMLVKQAAENRKIKLEALDARLKALKAEQKLAHEEAETACANANSARRDYLKAKESSPLEKHSKAVDTQETLYEYCVARYEVQVALEKHDRKNAELIAAQAEYDGMFLGVKKPKVAKLEYGISLTGGK
jgi:multidrug resistance efflux pump